MSNSANIKISVNIKNVREICWRSSDFMHNMIHIWGADYGGARCVIVRVSI
jgi:hypothetical protein